MAFPFKKKKSKGKLAKKAKGKSLPPWLQKKSASAHAKSEGESVTEAKKEKASGKKE